MATSEVKEEEKKDVHFVLVHGITGGGWCWYKVRYLLEKSGFTVSCPDLKSAGIDPTDYRSIKTFDEYNQPLVDLLASIPETQKVILVGHSAGGLSITDATHKFGRKIRVAIYSAATMLRRGFLTEQDKRDGIPSQFRTGQPPSKPAEKEFQRSMTPTEDDTLSKMLIKNAPVEAITEAKFPDTPGIDTVRRIYIKTTQDKVLKPEQQDAMINAWKPEYVFAIESEHDLIFTSSSNLADLLLKIAASI